MLTIIGRTPACLFVAAALACGSAEAARITDYESRFSSAWYARHAEGWHWYQDPTPATEEKAATPEMPPEPVEKPEKQEAQARIVPLMTPPVSPAPQTAAEAPKPPVAFSQAWLKKMIPVYLDNAVDNPTPENVEAFYVLQRLAMDKAEKFARVAETVRVGNRLIDETFRRPVSNYGLQEIDRAAEERTEKLLRKTAGFAGVFFFFKSGCPYCERQAPLIKALEAKGFGVMAVSLDGGALRTAQFEKTVRNAGQAERLNVQATPALFLANPKTNTIALLGEGLLSLPEIERRILLVSARNHWISEAELAQTRHHINPGGTVDLSDDLPKLIEALRAAEENPRKVTDVLALLEGRDAAAERARLSELSDAGRRMLMDEKGFVDPKALIAVMRGLHDPTSASAKTIPPTPADRPERSFDPAPDAHFRARDPDESRVAKRAF